MNKIKKYDRTKVSDIWGGNINSGLKQQLLLKKIA